MLKGFLGAASGSGLYVFSNGAPGGERAGYYLAGMVLLALATKWIVQWAFRAGRARVRTATYLVRSKLANREAVATVSTWAPLVESTRVISFGTYAGDEGHVRQSVSA